MSKKIVLIALIVLIPFLISSQSKQFVNQLPTLGWYGVPPSESTVARFTEQKDSGITYNFSFYENQEEVSLALDKAAEAGIKIIISCPELEKMTEQVVKRFMNHPALGGYFLKDEPGSNEFAVLGEWVGKIQSLDSKHICYINLYPNYAPASALGTNTYKEYINQFIQKVPVQLLSFDFYPIIESGLGKRIIREGWYENLEVISGEAVKAKKKFWAFALLTKHGAYPKPTLAEIRLQVFTNLAYGAQGIEYFTYWTPGDGNDKSIKGVIDNVTREKTDIYYMVTDVNNDLRNLSKVFYNSEVISVRHMGNIIPQGTKKLEVLPKNFKLLDTNGKNVIISQLQNGNNMYLVLVNKDFENKIDVTVQLNSSSLKRILNNGSSVSLRKGRSVVAVDPGDVLIYTWKK